MPSWTVSPVFSSSSRSFGRASFATSMRHARARQRKERYAEPVLPGFGVLLEKPRARQRRGETMDAALR
jgi:hypothetical protein